MNDTLQTYHGSCHCGRVTFDLNAKPISAVMDCNCSICRRRGALWHGASDGHLRITSGEEHLQLYQFGTMTAKHYFCRHCGIQPFVRPRLDPTRWAVNVRCIDGVDLSALNVRTFDGENWEAAAQAFVQGVRRAAGSHPDQSESSRLAP
ncbi:GFA family protein [Piscinibacter sp. XHJ-5]|uniref:GFA family protein n=1 Tax=Piscinibacter sp. XHJ-5 TaxID=3037797 RepID=UPI002452A839|nr:GFA family protein [Piscinibacter sp. XHJ-5]